MDTSTLFSFLFVVVGLIIITTFACKHGVFGEKCTMQNANNGPHQSTTDRIGIGVGVGARGSSRGSSRDARVHHSQVETSGFEQGEESSDGNYEEESRRSGGLSSDEQSKEDEDWGSTV